MKPQTSSPTSNVTPIKRNSPGVKTIWPITHACGHLAERDLSDRAADERAGFARWLAERPCTDCWKATHQADAASTKEWLETKRAEEQTESEAWSQQYRMPPLEGTERAVAWGVRCRHQLLDAAYTALVAEGETTEGEWETVEDAARTVTRAGWWIDQVRHEAPHNRVEMEGLHRRPVAAWVAKLRAA